MIFDSYEDCCGHRIDPNNPIVVITLTDNSTIEFEGVDFDTISPSGANRGVIAMEFVDSDRIVHVPFVKYWEIQYR